MALEKRLVVYDEPRREMPGLDQFLRSRHFQVYAVRERAELLEALEYSSPDGAIIAAPYDVERMRSLIAACRPYRQSVLIAVWPLGVVK